MYTDIPCFTRGFLYYQLFIKRRGKFLFDITGKQKAAMSVSPAQNIIKFDFLTQLASLIRDKSQGNIRFPEEGQSTYRLYAYFLIHREETIHGLPIQLESTMENSNIGNLARIYRKPIGN